MRFRVYPIDPRRVHSALGLVPLAVYVCIHAWEAVAALRGREAYADRLDATSSGVIALVVEILLVLVPLVAHAGLGAFLGARAWRGAPPVPPVAGASEDASSEIAASPYGSIGMRRLQAISGGVLLAFIVFHVVHLWVPKLAGRVETGGLYDVMRDDLGRPWLAAVYLAGITALAFHLGQGLFAAAHTFGLARSETSVRTIRGVSIAIAAIVWLAFVDVLAYFATGAALL